MFRENSWLLNDFISSMGRIPAKKSKPIYHGLWKKTIVFVSLN
jgi:hypothetical protein